MGQLVKLMPEFMWRFPVAALLAIVVGLTLMLGLLAIVSGLKFLFGFDAGRSYEDFIFAFCLFFVWPLFGLALVQRNLDEVIALADHKGGLMERGVSVLVNYIAVPLAIVYGLLLHAYAVKIVVLQNMPEGEIGVSVTLFVIVGTFAWLVAVWAALVCSYLMLRRSFADMRIVVGRAAVLLVLGSFGPLGAVGLTMTSQFAGLEKFLTEP